jgi:hypothetical protein
MDRDDKINNERNKGNDQDGSAGLGEIPTQSIIYGTGQIGTDSACGEGRYPAWKPSTIRDTTAGKILERLEKLEARTSCYVHSHQARLEARLGESKQFEQEFARESNQIKSDIYHLAVAQQENEIGDGD